jgi:hypothetical protein
VIAQDIGVALEVTAVLAIIRGAPLWGTWKRMAAAGTAAGGGVAFLATGAWGAGVACLLLGVTVAVVPWLPALKRRWRR